jgi:hypothetical protein
MTMKHLLMAVAGLALVLCSGFAVAQDDEEQRTFTYASYYYCAAGAEEGADKLMERDAAVLDKLVDDGAIKGWGWMSHHTGGKWRRIRWHQADSIVGALEALGTMNDALTEKYGEDDPASAEFAKACPQHDDYLWQVIDGGSGDAAGKVGISVYYKCDIVREDQADKIFESHAKPILDKMVEEGSLTGWSWQSHVIGGHVRRLQTMAAKDLPTLLASRASLIQQMYPEDSQAARDFSEICGPHQDYVWNYDLGK